MRERFVRLVALLGALALTATSCVEFGEKEPAVTDLTVSAREYRFEGVPTTVEPGSFRIRFSNRGRRIHMAQLVALGDHTPADLIAALKDQDRTRARLAGFFARFFAGAGAGAFVGETGRAGGPPQATATPTPGATEGPPMIPGGGRLPPGFPNIPPSLLRPPKDGWGVPQWGTAAGGVATLQPGASATAYTVLDPGRYALVCLVGPQYGAGETRTHGARGMVRSITVREARTGWNLPVGDTIIASDFRFVAPDITHGPVTLIGSNTGAQPHEWQLIRFRKGKSFQDLIDFSVTGGQGEAPITFEGGSAAVAPGGVSVFKIDVDVGASYGFVCLVPDIQFAFPHAGRGQFSQFRGK